MAETDHHRDLMNDLIKTLQAYYAGDPMVYVSGNLLLFYEPGNRRRHISPDVFVAKGVPKHQRLNYLIWEEGKGPDVTIELTSSSTRHEDRETKFRRYRDVLRVKEYFLFDPFGDYLKPPLQGYRLRAGAYQPIRPLQGRLPSKMLGLHLERRGSDLRLYDPSAKQWLPTPQERIAQSEDAVERLRRQIAQDKIEIESLRQQRGDLEGLRHRVDELNRIVEELRRRVDREEQR
ncbi:MAG TPA: Uma2 family endonuclease [Gemmataceae bacterium]|jgi:Uma2 family endonuclease